jgi:DNA replication licensing factor MCM5
MEGFDDPGIYYSDNFGSEEQANETNINNQAIKKKFKDFIRQFHEGNFNYKYRYSELTVSLDILKLCFVKFIEMP